VVQKKTALTFKGLDGVIRMTNKAGEKVSMSHKCRYLIRAERALFMSAFHDISRTT
jgi:hypothetical protein